jgi:hypothetical protein
MVTLMVVVIILAIMMVVVMSFMMVVVLILAIVMMVLLAVRAVMMLLLVVMMPPTVMVIVAVICAESPRMSTIGQKRPLRARRSDGGVTPGSRHRIKRPLLLRWGQIETDRGISTGAASGPVGGLTIHFPIGEPVRVSSRLRRIGVSPRATSRSWRGAACAWGTVRFR